jgi:hypothetical protein
MSQTLKISIESFVKPHPLGWVILIILIYLIGFFYLILPSPNFPSLSQSWRSTEEGDTWQNPNQKGYYTNLERFQVINEIKSKFNHSFLSMKLPGIKVNYPPEEAHSLVRDQLKSNYLEEIIFPLRESIFINGWEPENDPKMKSIPESKRSDLFANGQKYQAKITLYPIYSNTFARLLIWTLIFPITYLTIKSIKLSING